MWGKIVLRSLGYLCFLIPIPTFYWILIPDWNLKTVLVNTNYSVNFIIIIVLFIIALIVFNFIDAEVKDAARVIRLVWRAIKTSVVLIILWQGSDVLGVIILETANELLTKVTTVTELLTKVSFTFGVIFGEIMLGYTFLIIEALKKKRA
jgi:hypothetical protein